MWPKDAKAAVCLTGDIDSPHDVTEGRLERLWETLDDYKVKYTFPTTAQAILENPEIARQITKHGDEIAGHGDVHIEFRDQSYEEQKGRLTRMMGTIERVSGLRVRGFRAPYLLEDATTIKVADDLGLLYDSSITDQGAWCWHLGEKLSQAIDSKNVREMATNYMARLKGMPALTKGLSHLRPLLEGASSKGFGELPDSQPFNITFQGKSLNIFLVPVSSNDDYQLIDIGPRLTDWKKVAAVWKKDFDHYYERGGLYVLLAHPMRIGCKEYIGALRSLIEYANSKGDVWFATLTEIAEWWRKNQEEKSAS